MTMMEKIEKLREMLDEYEERLDDCKDEVREEVKENIKSEVEDMGSDRDLLDFINDNCGGDIHEMNEDEFNNYCNDHNLSYYDVLESSIESCDDFFGVGYDNEFKSSNDLEDFGDIEELVIELIDRDEDLGNSTIRYELDRLNSPEDGIEEEFLADLMKILGIEEEKKEVKKDSDEDFKKVVSWIYEHRMLGEDFDNKFPKLAEVYRKEN